jgi:hypothetical protein
MAALGTLHAVSDSVYYSLRFRRCGDDRNQDFHERLDDFESSDVAVLVSHIDRFAHPLEQAVHYVAPYFLHA